VNVQQVNRRAKFYQQDMAKTSATAAPTLSTQGILTGPVDTGIKVQFIAQVTRTSGDAAVTLKAYGYVPSTHTPAGVETLTGFWTLLETFDEMTVTGADFTHAQQLEVGAAYQRIYLQLSAISGTGASANLYTGIS